MKTKAEDYLSINRESWNKRVELHLRSDFYDMPGFLSGKSSLNSIEQELLGDVRDKRILHLQCHFGQDSLSLARLGAHVTGVDLSDKAIQSARELAQQTGLDARFICCDVYALPEHLHESFDIVFTSYGAIPWLPDLQRWAGVVAGFLKRGGRFVMAEFHPVVWMFDDRFERIAYSYFNAGEIIEQETGSYADPEASVLLESVCWNHPMSEVVNNLIQQGLQIEALQEYDYSPYNCFQGTIESEPGKFRIAHLGSKMPMTYALAAMNARVSK